MLACKTLDELFPGQESTVETALEAAKRVIEFVLDDPNTDLDYECSLILRSGLSKIIAELGVDNTNNKAKNARGEASGWSSIEV